jgi:hypothetical protein
MSATRIVYTVLKLQEADDDPHLGATVMLSRFVTLT